MSTRFACFFFFFFVNVRNHPSGISELGNRAPSFLQNESCFFVFLQVKSHHVVAYLEETIRRLVKTNLGQESMKLIQE